MKRCTVDIIFSLKGIRGREIYTIETEALVRSETLAYWRFEEDLIEEGLPTYECWCCLDWHEAGLKILDTKVRDA